MTPSIIDQLYTLTTHLLVNQTPKKTYEAIVKDTLSLLGGTSGSIFIAKDRKLVRKYTTVPHREQIIPRPNGYSYSTHRNQKIYILSPSVFHAAHPESTMKDPTKIILIPLSFNNSSMGVLSIRSDAAYTLEDTVIKVATLYGSLASLKIRDIQLYDEMKKALHARDLFISMASHELKTPLTTLNLYADLVIQSVKKEQIPSVQWANTIKEQTKRLQHLINELLEAKTVTSGKLQFSFNNYPVEDIVQKAIISSSAIYPKAKYVFKHPSQPHTKTEIIIDNQKLHQALTNLLTNAAKFSNDNERIEISLATQKKKVEIMIRDHGRGIDSKDLRHIFKKFYTGKTNKPGTGMGLGLYITKSIVEGHKGKISIDSKPNQGTTVTIGLPRNLPTENSAM